MCKFWIQNQFCAILGGWDICKTKPGSEIDKYIFILTWSGPHSLRVALRCPDWPLSGPDNPWEANFVKLGAPKGLSGYDRASQEQALSPQGHSCAVRTSSGQYEYVLVYSGTSFSFVNISALYNSTKLVRYLKFTYGSQFSEEKKRFRNLFIGFGDI